MTGKLLLLFLALLVAPIVFSLISPVQAVSEPPIGSTTRITRTITTPSGFFNGIPGPNVTVSYGFSSLGAFWYSNPQGNFTTGILTLKCGGLSFALPMSTGGKVYSNSTHVAYSLTPISGCSGNIWLYFKKQIGTLGYPSTDMKVIITGTLSTLNNQLNILFLGGSLTQKTDLTGRTNYQVTMGTTGLGFDWSDSANLNPVYNSIAKKLSYSVGTSFTIDPATIGTTTDATGTADDYQLKTFKAVTRYWDFYDDGTNCVWRTSTDGATWTATTTLRACALGSYLSIYYDSANTVIYYAYADSSASNNFAYRYGTPVSDGSISWSIAETTQATTGTAAVEPYIFATSTTDIWVSVRTGGSVNHQFETWRYSGSWAKVRDLSMGTLSPPTFPGMTQVILGLTSGKAHVYVDGVNNKACVETTGDNGATWTTAVCDTTITYRNDNRHHAVAVGDTVHFVGSSNDASPKIEYWKCTYPCSSITGLTQISSGLSGFTGTSISQDSNNLLIFYADASNVYYVQSTNGGSSFGSQQTVSSTESSIQGKTLTSSFAISSGDVQVTWTAGSASPYNVRFAQITLTVSDTITLTVSPVGGTQATFTLSGGGVSPTSVLGDGTSKSITCNSGNPTVTITAPADTTTNVYRFATLSKTTTFTCNGTGHTITYYYMDIITFQYSVNGGGTPTAPVLSITALGAASTVTAPSVAPATTYADHATSYSLTNPTTGSTSTERFQTNAASGTTSAGLAINPAYYHQYLVSVSSFKLSDGSALNTAQSAFTIACNQFGSSFTITALSTNYWVDGLTACSQTSVTWMGIEVAGSGTVTPSAGLSMTFNTLVQKDSASNQFQFAVASTTLSSVAWDGTTAQLSFTATGSGTRTLKLEEVSNTYKVEPGYISIDGMKYQTGSSGWAYSNPIFTFSNIAISSNTIIVSWAGQVGSPTPLTPPGQQGGGGEGSGTGAVNFFLAIPLSNFSLTAGQTTTLSVPLTWTNTNQIRVTSVYLSGPYSSWVTLVTKLPLLAYMNPATGSNTTLQFAVSIPAGAKPATYEVLITVSATSSSGSLSNLQKTLMFHVAQSLSQGIISGSPDLYLYAVGGVLALIVVVPALRRR